MLELLIGGKQTTVLVWTFGLCPNVRRLFLGGGNSACRPENELGSGTGVATVLCLAVLCKNVQKCVKYCHFLYFV